MRSYEFTKVIDCHALALYELQTYLNENKQFMGESVYDYDNYRSIVDEEKPHTVAVQDLVVGEEYAPMSVTGAPVGKMMILFVAKDAVKFDSINRHNSVFKDVNGNVRKFPPGDYDMGESCIDLLIFKSVAERHTFISLLNLKFCDWRITTYTV